MRKILRQRIQLFKVVGFIILTLFSSIGISYATTSDFIFTVLEDESSRVGNEPSSNGTMDEVESDSNQPLEEEVVAEKAFQDEINEDQVLQPEQADLEDVESELYIEQQGQDLESSHALLEQEDNLIEESITNGSIRVETFEGLRRAIIDPEVSQIEVIADLIRGETDEAIGVLDRSLTIDGSACNNGCKIDFGADDGKLSLIAPLEGEAATLRITNLQVRKDGSDPIISASEFDSHYWTLELEGLMELASSEARLVQLKNGAIHFTGGVNTFNQETGDNIVLEAKHIDFRGQSETFFNSGDSSVIYVGETIVQPTLTVSEGSSVSIRAAGGANVIDLRGEDAIVQIKDGSSLTIEGEGALRNADLNSNNAIILSGGRPTLTVTSHSTLEITTNNDMRGIALVADQAKFEISDGARVKMMTDNGNSITLGGDSPTLKVSGEGTALTASSEVLASEVNATIFLGFLDGNNAKLEISGGAQVIAIGTNANSITLRGNSPILKVSDERTELTASSEVAPGLGNATIYLGGLERSQQVSQDAHVDVSNGARVEVTSNESTAMSVRSLGGNFDLTNQASLSINSGSSSALVSGSAAPLRFIRHGNYTFTIDNAKMSIDKTGGSSQGVRLIGGDNDVIVQNGGQFIINNPGNGVPHDGLGHALGNQGIFFGYSQLNNNNSFTVIDEGSMVRIIAENGPAIDMGETIGNKVNVQNGGYFQAIGRTATANEGIIRANILTVDFDNPLYMDFRNNRDVDSNGGNIFSVNDGSSLRGTKSDLALWKNGSDLDGDPQRSWTNIDYNLTGINFSILPENGTDVPYEFNTDYSSFGSQGLAAYSRLNVNNARAIVDEIRVPTNADKSIFGFVSIPVGLDETRPAWTDEVTLEVRVKRADNGSVLFYDDVRTVGSDDESDGISIYGQDPQPGIFQVELEDFLQEGDEVWVVNVKRGQVRSRESIAAVDFSMEPVTTFPIIPPTPAVMETLEINPYSQFLRGQVEDPSAELTVTYNDELLDLPDISIRSDGSFSVPIHPLDLQVGDQLQVFLRDNAGLAVDVVNPPDTNNERGNINPAEPLDFHDAKFEAAPIVRVLELTEVSPVDPLDPEVEVDPINPPGLPEYQGPVSIDFVSQFNFGVQSITNRTEQHYAKPQQVIDDQDIVVDRPNYVQISDQRTDNGGWKLVVRQEHQFRDKDSQEHELFGAFLTLQHGQINTAASSTAIRPNFVESNPIELVPGVPYTLVEARQGEGRGTWIYHFGNYDTYDQGIFLEVPGIANPKQTTYTTTLNWELSATYPNE